MTRARGNFFPFGNDEAWDCPFGKKPKTTADWIIEIAGAVLFWPIAIGLGILMNILTWGALILFLRVGW